MDTPRLLALITFPFARTLAKDDEGHISERAQRIAVDTDGRLWALVERIEPFIDKHGSVVSNMGRLTLARWQLVKAAPFVTEDPIEFFERRER